MADYIFLFHDMLWDPVSSELPSLWRDWASYRFTPIRLLSYWYNFTLESYQRTDNFHNKINYKKVRCTTRLQKIFDFPCLQKVANFPWPQKVLDFPCYRKSQIFHVQVVLCSDSGTSAQSRDNFFFGTDFNNSLIKYLAPILYEADRSQLYCFPVENVHKLWLFLSLATAPEPS